MPAKRRVKPGKWEVWRLVKILMEIVGQSHSKFRPHFAPIVCESKARIDEQNYDPCIFQITAIWLGDEIEMQMFF